MRAGATVLCTSSIWTVRAVRGRLLEVSDRRYGESASLLLSIRGK